MTNEDLGPIKEKAVTCEVATRAELVRQEGTISPLKVPDVGNVNVPSLFQNSSRGRPNFESFL